MIVGWCFFWLMCASSVVTRGAHWTKDIGDGRPSSCDMIFSSDTTKSGLIMSPGYPNPYPARTRCRYDFQGRGKERIQIIFQDFALPRLPFESDNSKKCESTDALMAFVQIDGTMEKIDSFCDEVRPRPLMSNGPKMSLEFNGLTSSRDSRGFKAVYTFTENFGITTGRQEPKYPCGFAYHSNETRNGTFTSPNYPGFYPRDTECHYFFNGEPKERVRIVFHYFDVEGIQPCNEATASDFVEFSNFMNRDRKFTRHCGQHTEFQLESDKTFFHVTFKSNGRLDGTGFNASYFFFNEVLNNTAKTPHTSAAESRGYSFAASLLVLSQLLVLLL